VRPLLIISALLLLLLPGTAQAALDPSFTFSPGSVAPGQPVNFVASDASADRYEWDFGDGGRGEGRGISHAFGAPGTYNVTLTVRERGNGGNGNGFGNGARSSQTQVVTVRAPAPPPAPTPPPTPPATPTPPTPTPPAPTPPAPTPPTPAPPTPTPPTPTPPATPTTPATPTGPTTPANRAPTAGYLATTDGLRAQFTSTASDPDQERLEHSWSFGDGRTSTAPDPTHRYEDAGSYVVRLTVTDPRGASSSTTQSITVRAATTTSTSAGTQGAATTAGAFTAGGAASSSAGTGTGSLAPAPHASLATARRMSPFPVVRIAGRLSGSRTLLSHLSVRAPRGARVTVTCRGRGCAARTQRLSVGRTLLRVRRLERKRLATGAVIEVRVTRRGYIGKYTRLTFRTGRAPARTDACLAPGSSRPVRCG
jgi:PKD repeat protein